METRPPSRSVTGGARRVEVRFLGPGNVSANPPLMGWLRPTWLNPPPPKGAARFLGLPPSERTDSKPAL